MRSEEEIRALLKLAEKYNRVFSNTKVLDYLDGTIKTIKWILEEK